VFYDPSCRGAEAYRDFAKEFARRNPTRVVEPAPAPAADAAVPTEAVNDQGA